MTRSLPGADQALIGRLVVRQDDLEARMVQVRADVDRLGRATGALTESLRRLPTTPRLTSTRAATTGAGAGEEVGQRDWFTVTDPGAAWEWLLEALDWWDRIGQDLFYRPLPCWPWHPRAVAASLALVAHHQEVYAGDKALPVSDFLTRWVPTLGRHVVPKSSDCSVHEHYQDHPTTVAGGVGGVGLGRRAGWRVHPDQLPDYAHWWATDRAGIPPGLTPTPPPPHPLTPPDAP